MGTYNLGTVGLGHWVKRLHEVLKHNQNIKLVKAVGTRTFNDKREELERYGISEDSYYRVDPDETLPEKFFENLDIVHIASPNQFHKSQTMQALVNGKVTVAEKTFATNKEDFNKVVEFIRDNRQDKVTVHLHYLSKTLTTELKKRLPQLVEKYGRITGISATFFEKTSDEDMRRRWLFKPENGGIFMDWIHPVSIASNALKAGNWKLVGANTFVVQPAYDSVNPTAVEAVFKIDGENFRPNANIIVRVGKGFDLKHKRFRLNFENATVDLNYLNTEEEVSTGKRGEMIIIRDNDMQTISPEGPLCYETMIEEMLYMANGRSPPLTVDEIVKIYKPEWDFQKISKELKPERNQNAIQEFVRNGLANEI